MDATIAPIKIQSTSTTQRRNLMKPTKCKCKTSDSPVAEMINQMESNTKNAGSSRAN